MYIYNDLARRIEVGRVIKGGKLTVDDLRPGESLEDSVYVLYHCDDGKIRGCSDAYVFDIIEDAYRMWEKHIKEVMEKNGNLPALKAMLSKEWSDSLLNNKESIHPEAYMIFKEAF